MIQDILKRLTAGIACGGLATFIALTIMKFNHIEAPVSEIWAHMLAGLLMGIYFGLSSFIFETEKWSNLKKTIIHFFSSITAYYSIALPVGWVPFTPFAIIISGIVFMLLYAVYWTGFYLYFRKVAQSLNEDLQNKS